MKDRLILCVAGAKGSVASTVAAMIAGFEQFTTLQDHLITSSKDFPSFRSVDNMYFAGWDVKTETLSESFEKNQTIENSKEVLKKIKQQMDNFPVYIAPDPSDPLHVQLKRIRQDIIRLKETFPNSTLVFVNLLPVNNINLSNIKNYQDLLILKGNRYRDLAYVLAAIEERVPIVNFTPNYVESPILMEKMRLYNIPYAGKDGKTGQTFIKQVIASAFRVRKLFIEGWFSANILGNEDGKNLRNPEMSQNKIRTKTQILEKVLKYKVKTHIVRIDYYPPRGDRKEAWDVVDFMGIFGEMMSLRLNLLGKDSVLAAPLVIDLARIIAKFENRKGGPISELAFFFKAPVGERVNYSFEEQTKDLYGLIGKL